VALPNTNDKLQATKARWRPHSGIQQSHQLRYHPIWEPSSLLVPVKNAALFTTKTRFGKTHHTHAFLWHALLVYTRTAWNIQWT